MRGPESMESRLISTFFLYLLSERDSVPWEKNKPFPL